MATLEQMYAPQPFSPQTVLTQDVGASDTRIYVDDVSVFPTPPTLATLGNDAATAETVKVVSKGSNFIDVQRGLLGTAKAWTTNTIIARNFSAADQTAIQNNINKLNTVKLETVTTANIDDNILTNAKLAQVASGTLKGRKTANQGNVEDLSVDDVRTMLNVANGADKTATVLESVQSATLDDNDRVLFLDSAQSAGSKTRYALWSVIKTALNDIFVPKTRKINNKALSADITLSAADVSATPASDNLVNGGSIVGTLGVRSIVVSENFVVGSGDAYIRLDTDTYGNAYLQSSEFGSSDEWPSASYATLSLATPTEDSHAATKSYVDSEFSKVATATSTVLPTSGSALVANTIYNVTAAVNTYSFVSPTSGWAHGSFETGSSPNIAINGNIIGKLPTFEANKNYEFDVYNGVWVVQEVVAQ